MIKMINKYQSQQIQDLLTKTWNELEIRFYLSSSECAKLMEKYPANAPPICSLVLSYGDVRRESFYDSGVKIKSVDQTKISIGYVKTDNCKISFAQETPITNFETGKIDEIRCKYRVSHITETYRLDFTMTRELTKKNTLAEAKKFWSELGGDWKLELEFITPPNYVDILNCINMITGCNNQLQDFYKILDRRPNTTIKNLTNNPLLLTRAIFENINFKKYIVMDKTDGIRCVIKLTPSTYEIYTESGCENYICETAVDRVYVFDGEFIGAKYVIFDLLIVDVEVAVGDFMERRMQLEKIPLPKNMMLKPVNMATPQNIRRIYYTKHEYEIDGLIFNEVEASYKYAKIYKWKPAELTTIDFLIVPFPYKGIKPYISDKNMYILMCGCEKSKIRQIGNGNFMTYYKRLLIENNLSEHKEYVPVPFSPPLNKLAYIYESDEVLPLCVGEFALKQNGTNIWDLVKIRHDKTLLIKSGAFGNNYFVAETHFNELQNPIKIDELCSEINNNSKINRKSNITRKSDITIGRGYFEKNKSEEYREMIGFNNFVKRNILQMVSGVVLDIGSGKGQDVFTYNSLGVRRVIFTEPDTEAVIELTRRCYDLDNTTWYGKMPKPKKNMEFEIINKSYENLTPQKVDIIVCNFAVHYLLAASEDYDKFVKFCETCVSKLVILTCFDSEIIESHMTRDVYKSGDKYYIEKRDGRYFVKHHFASELVPENIVNSNKLISCFKQYKYQLIKRDSFSRYLKHKPINEIDATYSSFYQYLVFRKKCN